LDEYPPELVGICYDSGRANSNTLKQMDFLDARKDRLMALHLHDNNGDGDQHQPPFYGNVDWTRLSKIIASSGYSREISFELSNHNVPTYMAEYSGGRQPDFANRRFLTDAYHRCARFASMIQSAKAGN